MKKILAIVGSLRKNSFNLQLAKEAKRIIGDKAHFEILEYSQVPLFNEDDEANLPVSVKSAREKVLSSDAIWFFTPEYNHFFSGVLKNLTDWLSRETENDGKNVFSKKYAAISGISPGMGGTVIAQDHLLTLLGILNMKVMNYPRLAIPNLYEQTDNNSNLSLTTSLVFLEKQVKAFLKFIDRKSILWN